MPTASHKLIATLLVWLLTLSAIANKRGPDASGSFSGVGGIGGLLARTDASSSDYYHADGGGNITGLMDGSENMVGRYLYNPFGKILGQWGKMAEPNVMRFASMPFYSKPGIYGFWGTLWTPELQRWLNNDPVGEAGGINLTMGMHNNPVNYVDPWGLRDNDGDEDAGISDARLNMAANGSGFAADYGNDKDRQNRSDEIMDQGEKALKNRTRHANQCRKRANEKSVGGIRSVIRR